MHTKTSVTATRQSLPFSLAVAGSAGKMGQEVLAALAANTQTMCTQALVSPQSRFQNKPLEKISHYDCYKGYTFETTLNPHNLPQALIVFSLASTAIGYAQQAAKHGVALLVCSTGFSETQISELTSICRSIPWCLAPNTSVGIMWLARLATQLAKAIPDADIEIVESHHKNKIDAPSGTAIRLGQAVAKGRNIQLESQAVYGRAGMKKRTCGEIGFSALRLGSVVGEHSIHFGLLGETITLTHQVLNRQTFAQGAIQLACQLIGKKPAHYQVEDLL